MNKFNALKTF